MINEKNFEKTIDGQNINLYTLKNNQGTIAQITNFGGRIVSLYTHDKNNQLDDIVLGYESIDEYFSSHESYYGAIIGRYGNRIGKGVFSINEETFQLGNLDGMGNQLHGGKRGYHDVIWTVEKHTENQLTLSYLSVDGEDGFPGNLKVIVDHILTDDNELQLHASATTDKTTHVNLTYHSFFNLGGVSNPLRDILDNVLQINADYYTPVGDTLLPDGTLAPVRNTPLDFRQPKAIGTDITADFKQLSYGNGYDHNFVIKGNGLKYAAKITDPTTGRSLELITTEPGVQFYSCNALTGKDYGKNNINYPRRHAFCLEPQHYPDTPNIPEFPSTILNPGEVYETVCIYKFSVEK